MSNSYLLHSLHGLVRPRETALALSCELDLGMATEALRTLFLDDLIARPVDKERHTGILVDRAG